MSKKANRKPRRKAPEASESAPDNSALIARIEQIEQRFSKCASIDGVVAALSELQRRLRGTRRG